MFDKLNKKFFSVCKFQNGALVIILMDIKGNAYKIIKCEDETVYNYFQEVFNL